MAIQAQVTLRTVDAVPENFVTNSFAFTFGNTLADLNATTVALDAFYSTLSTEGVLGAGLAAGPHLVKYYLAGGPQPNYPQLEEEFSLAGATSGLSMPSEVALVLSFQGQRIPGEDQARKQGRIYLGPIAASVNSGGRPSGAALTDVANAAVAFATAIDGTTSGKWAVWSVANSTAVEVTDGWCDNAFDTQRRRGLVRTSRTSWSV